MRALFSIAALLVVVGLVGLLAKKQLGAVAPAPSAGSPSVAATPASQVQQVGKQVENLMQQPRPQAPEQ
jgi:hypothetical protein